MKTRIAVFGTIGAVAATLALTATSSATHNVNPINIRVDPDRPFIHGVIQSKAERCERGRYLFVKKVKRNGLKHLVGDDITSYRGGWSVDINKPGRYNIRIHRDGSCGGDKVKIVSPGQ